MIDLALTFATGCFGLGLVFTLARVLVSTGIPDRVLALDTMVINMIALVILLGIGTGSGINFEAALLLAMTGFVSTVAYCRFMLRGDIIE